jgi:hypothetical protein
MALRMALSAGLGRRSRPLVGCMSLMRMLRIRMINIRTKGTQTAWAMRPTPICAVCWITCPKPNG